ncbi:MAG: serine/threonine-protein kinase [Dermatophilaceae bacterium]
MTMEPGTVYGNRYTLYERIAIGGMGEVWKATDKVLGRTVAIKLLSPNLAQQPGFEERFREEARHTALLSHHNIATVYDYGQTDGASWLVMEYVEGEPLSAIIRSDGPQSPRRTAMIVGQCAEALQAAHEAGVIHRDVKPANIMVRPDGVVKLTDFGIARVADAAPMTRTGEVMGTAQYISPEQAMGKPVSPASDIYSLGVVAHELLTGKRPFDDGSPVATAMAHVNKPPPALPASVPPALAAIIMSCLAKEPNQRPASAKSLAAAMRGGPAAAAAAMPPSFETTAVMGQAAATQQLTSPGAYEAPPSQSTSQRTVERPPGTGSPPERKGVPGWAWALLGALAILAVWAILQFSGVMGGNPAPSTTTTQPTTTTTTTTAPVGAVIDRSIYVGRSADAVEVALRELGYTTFRRESVESSQAAGTIVDIQPYGSVLKSDLITMSVSKGPAPTATATTPTAPPSPSPTASETPAPTASRTPVLATPATPATPSPPSGPTPATTPKPNVGNMQPGS